MHFMELIFFKNPNFEAFFKKLNLKEEFEINNKL